MSVRTTWKAGATITGTFREPGEQMKNLARFGVILSFLALSLGAWLRLSQAGIGCTEWPTCYGLVGWANAETMSAPRLYALHDGLVGALGLCALFGVMLALRDSRHRVLALALLGLSAALAWLEAQGGGQGHPGRVIGGVMLGFTLVGLWGWLLFRLSPGAPRYTESRIRHVRPLVLAALILLGLQIGFGGLTSANYAGTACGFPDCDGAWYPDATLYAALRVDRPYTLAPDGHAQGSFERQAVNLAHRWFAVLLSLVVFAAAIAAFPATETVRRLGLAAVTLVFGEWALGITAALTGLPAWLAVLHPALAAALLLVLLKWHALSRERWWHDYSNVPGPGVNEGPTWRG